MKLCHRCKQPVGKGDRVLELPATPFPRTYWHMTCLAAEREQERQHQTLIFRAGTPKAIR